MSDDPRIQYKFMIPESLKAALEDAAHDHRRSLSAEIIARLQASLDSALYVKPMTPEETQEMIREIAKEVMSEAFPDLPRKRGR